jgi:hypothetical protein
MIGAIARALSTLFWVTQSNPSPRPHIPFLLGNTTSAVPASSNLTASTFVELQNTVEPSQWLKAFERSLADFLSLLSLGEDFKVGIIMDYITKMVDGALTFGLLAIALRRKFERKFIR